MGAIIPDWMWRTLCSIHEAYVKLTTKTVVIIYDLINYAHLLQFSNVEIIVPFLLSAYYEELSPKMIHFVAITGFMRVVCETTSVHVLALPLFG